jgi:hypothetical protein
MGAVDGDGRVPHRIGESRDLVCGLPLDSEAHEKGGDLHVADVATDELLENAGSLLLVRSAFRQTLEGVGG